MQNIFIDILPPWVETGLQPAFYDLESGTVLQQTARMYAKVRELIKAFNDFSEDVTATVNEYISKFTELYNYVHDYFDNLDVQEEINNKIDAMVEDGTFKELLDESLMCLATKQQESAIGMSFYIEGGNITNFINYTNDGVNWKQVKLGTVIGRDPSLIYDSKRKKFYISVTPRTSQDYSFSIYETEDFVTFTEHQIVIPNYYGKDIMAPDLYMDEENDQIIVNFTYATGNTVTDCDGQTINEYNLYRTVIGNLDDMSDLSVEEEPTALSLQGATNTCMIDSNVIKVGDYWYLNCKDDQQKVIQVYQSVDGIHYILTCPNILNDTNFNDNTLYIEGGSWFKFNGSYYIIADNYYNLHTIIVGKTDNFTKFYDFAITNMNRMRHPSAISVDSNSLKLKMLTLPEFGYNTNDRLPFYGKPSNMSKQIPDDFEGEIIAVPDMMYTFLGNAHITNIRSPFHAEKISCMFATSADKKIIIDKIQAITVNKTLHNSVEGNEKVFNIYMSSSVNAYPIDTYHNFTEFDDTFITNYYDVAAGFSLTEAYAYRQGNLLSIMFTLRPSATVSGNQTILTKKSGVNGIFTPKKKVILSHNAESVLTSAVMFPVSGGVQANFSNAPVFDYTFFATYIVG